MGAYNRFYEGISSIYEGIYSISIRFLDIALIDTFYLEYQNQWISGRDFLESVLTYMTAKYYAQ